MHDSNPLGRRRPCTASMVSFSPLVRWKIAPAPPSARPVASAHASYGRRGGDAARAAASSLTRWAKA
eukprot:160704-Alexandrium_andersonii.AAC.1